MATLKHISSKNADYGKSIEYLLFEHEKNGAPVRDGEGNMLMREGAILEGINCNPFTYDKECEMLNWKYHKNQKFSDIKSHQYIISYDPKDREEGLITPERAQQLGMDFARRCFPGHQILVCTHSDGHNESGNIHTHIIFNSLRKLDVERQSFMEREIDSRAGYKHNLTKGYLEYLQAEVMKMCEREGLHQVDLLTPAKEKITNAEYRARETGQKKLDERNERILAAQMIPRKTVFQTQKQFLRDAIRDTSKRASSLSEWMEMLREKYGIEVKESRGRFSYLHPDRKKYITGRALGTDFEKESVLAVIQSADEKLPVLEQKQEQEKYHEEVTGKVSGLSESSAAEAEPADVLPPVFRGQEDTEMRKTGSGNIPDEHVPVQTMSPPSAGQTGEKRRMHDYDPAYNYNNDPLAVLYIRSRLRLVVDIQTNLKAQQSRAYAEEVELTNLQEMARTLIFLEENGIGSREELRERQEEILRQISESEDVLGVTQDALRKTNEQIHFAGQYYATRSVHADFMKAWNKGRFRSQHKEELDRYDEAAGYFKKNTDGEIPKMQDLRNQKTRLSKSVEDQKASLKSLRQSGREWQTAAKNIEALLGAMEEKTRVPRRSGRSSSEERMSL